MYVCEVAKELDMTKHTHTHTHMHTCDIRCRFYIDAFYQHEDVLIYS